MTILSRLLSLLSRRSSGDPSLPDRHERREAARRRHRQTGEPLWTPEDRHLGEPGERGVADGTPGTPGHYGSVRTIKDE
jgi:hypothetical protein